MTEKKNEEPQNDAKSRSKELADRRQVTLNDKNTSQSSNPLIPLFPSFLNFLFRQSWDLTNPGFPATVDKETGYEVEELFFECKGLLVVP